MDEQTFPRLVRIYLDTRRNKRYGRDAATYEMSWVANLVRGLREREERTLRVRHNYAFLTSIPRWREIMATEFAGRIIDHEICDVAIPAAEKILSPHTYNNRAGKGAQAALNALIQTIDEVSEFDTRPCRIIKIDLKGYFPNARWDIAERGIFAALDLSAESAERINYLKWLTTISINCNPAAHCEKRTPVWLWREHIEPEKSILTKPAGVGAAIGRLIWQTAMGLYINDEIKWLTEDCGLRAICFVDDIVIVVPERLHAYALALLPELRRRLAAKGVSFNERKFYDQPHGHGAEFLGSHIRPGRVHINDKTYRQALVRLDELNRTKEKAAALDNFLASMNSYFGLLKQRTDYRRTEQLRDTIAADWWQYLQWDAKRRCVVCREEYRWRERMNRKYHLKLRYNGKRRTRRAA